MGYRKINTDEFEEIIQSPKIKLSHINDQIDILVEQKQSIIEPTRDELLEFAEINHPIKLHKIEIDQKLTELRELKKQLQLL